MELKCSLTETESIADSHEQVLQSHCRSQVYRHGVQANHSTPLSGTRHSEHKSSTTRSGTRHSEHKSHVYRHGVQSLEARGDHSNQDIMHEDLHTMYNAHHALCTADLEGGHRIMHTTQG